jgi:hypothetical protein
MLLIYVLPEILEVYREEERWFKKKFEIPISGLQDTITKTLSAVERALGEGVKTVIFRGTLANAMYIKENRGCVKCKVMFCRFLVSMFCDYAREIFDLDKPATMLQTIDGKRRCRKNSINSVRIGEGNILFSDVRQSLEDEIEGVISPERKVIVERALEQSLAILERLDLCLYNLKKNRPRLTFALESAVYRGGAVQESSFILPNK